MSSSSIRIRQEPHRVYWQQWAAAPSVSLPSTTDGGGKSESHHQVVTKSAAVRISDDACAQDVTRLLQTSIVALQTTHQNDDKQEQDENALVLVATLYNTDHTVEFEHDNNSNNQKNASFSREPFHIIKTLEGTDKPLQVRDAMLERIRHRHPPNDSHDHTSIAPKLQWFFVASSSREMPSYIELDGYCTSDDESSESSGSDSDCENDDDEKSGVITNDTDDTAYWWRNQASFVSVVPSDETDSHHQQDESIPSPEKRIRKQQRRIRQLKLEQQQSDQHHANNNVSGFLLLQSRHDAHVWKQVHCVLTDQHLWIVSRLYSMTDTTKMARHLNISLHGAALVADATTLDSPLSTIPHVFSVVSKSNVCYNFRASSQTYLDYWVTAISNGIQISQENEFLHHANLICEHTTLARNQRLQALAIQPLVSTSTTNDDAMDMSVLKWGMEVAEYRELCRHLASRMPNPSSQRPVIASSQTNKPTPKRLFSSSSQEDEHAVVLEKDTQDMMASTWDLAAVLLARAVQCIHPMTTTRSMSLESACRHVDYILTGKFRDMNDIVASSVHVKTSRRHYRNNSTTNAKMEAPPMDLFDTLLTQLQSQCMTTSNVLDESEAPAIETPLSK